VVCKGLSSRKQHPGRGRVALVSVIREFVQLSFNFGDAQESERNYEIVVLGGVDSHLWPDGVAYL
jgi:hypothetical protein